MTKVLVNAPLRQADMEGLRTCFPDVTFVMTRTTNEELREIVDADAVFGHPVRETFLAAKKLRWIQYQGAGVEWIYQIPELSARGVTVTNTRGAHAATIAEHTIGMLICLARGFQPLIHAQAGRIWVRPLVRPAVGLSGLTMGIIGLGQIGRAVASRAAAFEMKVIAVDPMDMPKPGYVADLRRLDGLAGLLSEADAVVITAPLTNETRNMIGAAQFALMKPGAFLVVISRGGIVDEGALIEALSGGRIAGAGLDVQLQKPVPPESPLWDAPNLFLTPHCSGESQQTTENVIAIMIDNLRRFRAGAPLLNVVDLSRGY